jgi:16S rRNA (guanine966-N2)-methyltransferase
VARGGIRIIAGRLRGRRLDTPGWDGLRPTSDRLRETLFDVLGDRVAGARVLDGCAGTGALGLEAISRGASHVTFVDRDPRAVRLITANLGRCGITEGYAMMRSSIDAPGLFADDRFDLILLDPPYADEAAIGARVARAGGWLADGGLLVLEHARRHPAPQAAGDLIRARDLVSGDSALTFYRHGPARVGCAAAGNGAPVGADAGPPADE